MFKTIKLSDEVTRSKQDQIIKLISQSFYKELLNYGIKSRDIVTLSMNLLDYVVKSKPELIDKNDSYHEFSVKKIKNNWETEKKITIDDVSISPLKEDDLDVFLPWMVKKAAKQTLIGFLPKTLEESQKYFFDSARNFFSIYHEDGNLIGFIGAHETSNMFKNIEMKKYIGNEEYRKQGFGKKATFLFLYYVFEIIKFNKVNIYSIDTNIRNVNLNSKFGFELEGVLIKEIIYDDTFRDVLRMGLHHDRWEKIFLK